MSESLIFLGCKDSGKTFHGKALANALSVPFLDTDYVIQKMQNMPYKEFYKNKGLVEYVKAEETACNVIAKYASNKQVVVSTGGNIYDNPPALNALRPIGKFIFIHFKVDYYVDKKMQGIEQNEFGTIVNLPNWISEKNPKTLDDVRQMIFDRYSQRLQQYSIICDEDILLTGSTKEENFNLLYSKFR